MVTRFLISWALLSLSTITSAYACEDITVKSTLDEIPGTSHLCLASDQKAPLLVFLPAWSGGFPYWDEVVRNATNRGWHLLAPKHRGPNNKEIGSELAIQDVVDAIAYAKKHAQVDDRRIYAIGASGGGIWL